MYIDSSKNPILLSKSILSINLFVSALFTIGMMKNVQANTEIIICITIIKFFILFFLNNLNKNFSYY